MWTVSRSRDHLRARVLLGAVQALVLAWQAPAVAVIFRAPITIDCPGWHVHPKFGIQIVVPAGHTRISRPSCAASLPSVIRHDDRTSICWHASSTTSLGQPSKTTRAA